LAATYDKNAPKKPVNLSVNVDLLRQAKELGINLSACMEGELARLVAAERRKQLQNAMQEATEIWSAFRDRHGSAIDEFREIQ
jgi:antitoxin CcdA